MQKFLLLQAAAILFFLLPQLCSSQVVINEYSCSNRDIIADQDGDYEDYIELYNNSSSAISLSGYYLTDDLTNLTKWVFPASLSIPANGF